MTEQGLKDKLLQWLGIKKEADRLEKACAMNLAASEPLDKNKYLKNMLSQMRQQKGLPATPEAGNTLDYSKMKPARGGIVQGQRFNPRPSMAPASGKADKLFDPRLSGTKKPDVKKAGEPQPAIVSEPIIVSTQSSTSTPRTVESPNVVNGYAIIGDFFRKKKKKK